MKNQLIKGICILFWSILLCAFKSGNVFYSHEYGWIKLGKQLGSGNYGEVYDLIALDLPKGEEKVIKIFTFSSPPEELIFKINSNQAGLHELYKDPVLADNLRLLRVEPAHLIYATSLMDKNTAIAVQVAEKLPMSLAEIESFKLREDSVPAERLDTAIVADLIYTNILEAIRQLASKGLIHSDIKPSNILIKGKWSDLFKGEVQLVLADLDGVRKNGVFSLARTPEFSPPEYYLDKGHGYLNTHAADLFSLGATLYWFLDETYIATEFKSNYQKILSNSDRRKQTISRYDILVDQNIARLERLYSKDANYKKSKADIFSYLRASLRGDPQVRMEYLKALQLKNMPMSVFQLPDLEATMFSQLCNVMKLYTSKAAGYLGIEGAR